MSKKKFKKFKKISNQQLQTNNAATSSEKRDAIVSELNATEKERKELAEKDIYDTDKYDHVKKDVKKITIILGSIILLLFGIYFLSLKTTYLSTAGNWIYKILNIQAE